MFQTSECEENCFFIEKTYIKWGYGQEKSKWGWLYFCGALGGALYGYDTGVNSGAILFIKEDLRLNAFTEGLVVSSILIGDLCSKLGFCSIGPAAKAVSRACPRNRYRCISVPSLYREFDHFTDFPC